MWSMFSVELPVVIKWFDKAQTAPIDGVLVRHWYRVTSEKRRIGFWNH